MLLCALFSAGQASAASVQLAWDESPGPDLAGYRIYWGFASRSYSSSVDVGLQTTFEVSGLEEGRTYYFAGTALNTSAHESVYSNEVSKTFAPPAPAALAASDGTLSDRVGVTWSSATGAGEYRVYRSESSAGERIALGEWQSTKGYEDTAAEPGTTYHYWVKARNSGGESPFSEPDTGHAALPPETVSMPLPPSGPTHGHPYLSYTFLAGEASSSHGDPLQFRFEIEGGAVSDWLPEGTVSFEKAWSAPGVYHIRVRARCLTHPHIVSDASPPLTVSILPDPAAPVPPVVSIEASDGAYPDNVRLIWTPDDNAAEYRAFRAATAEGDKTALSGWASAASFPPCLYVDPENQDWRPEVLGDFNGDGMADVLWRNEADGRIYLWFMNGVTVFDHGVLDASAGSGWKLAGAGDFDGDGRDDLVWREQSAGTIEMWLVDGFTVQERVQVATVDNTDWHLAAVGDFDGDGLSDILWNHRPTEALFLWLMAGATRTSSGWIESQPDADRSLAGTADFNGDGRTDLLLRSRSSGQLDLWLMDGVGSTARAPIEATPATDAHIVSVGDFDGDLSADILWRGEGDGEITLWRMNAHVRIAVNTVEAVPDPDRLPAGTADFNGDGTLDLLWKSSADSLLEAWLMNGGTITGIGTGLHAQAASICYFDAAVEPGVAYHYWVKSRNAAGEGSFDSSETGSAASPASDTRAPFTDPAWRVTGSGDVDGDGMSDVVWRHAETGEVCSWLLDGGVVGALRCVGSVPEAAWRMEGAGDMDGDGVSELLWRHLDTGELYLWTMSGGEYLTQNYVSTLPDPSMLLEVVADFDGDGKSDLLWQDEGTGEIDLWLMQGHEILQSGQVGVVSNLTWHLATSGDFNGDDRADLLWYHRDSGRVYIWHMDGFAIMQGIWMEGSEDPGWMPTGAADFDGDGLADSLWEQDATGGVELCLMHEFPAACAPFGPPAGTDWQATILRDANLDSRADLLWRNRTSGQVDLWLLNGHQAPVILTDIQDSSVFHGDTAVKPAQHQDRSAFRSRYLDGAIGASSP